MIGVPTGHARSSRRRAFCLCRECDGVLWRAAQSCPSCRAQSPSLRPGPAAKGGHRRLAITVAVAAPVALVIADEALHRLLIAS